MLVTSSLAAASEKVTVDNFVRAETDVTMRRYAKQGGFGRLLHVRMPTPINEQKVIRSAICQVPHTGGAAIRTRTPPMSM